MSMLGSKVGREHFLVAERSAIASSVSQKSAWAIADAVGAMFDHRSNGEVPDLGG